MKKIVCFLLILTFFINNKINVFAIEDNQTEVDNEQDKEENDEEDDIKSDATLKNITINGINVVCTKDTAGYLCENIIKDNSITEVKIAYELSNSKATVEPKSRFTKELEEGENVFEVKVTSEDKTKSNTYTFKITKMNLSTDSGLKKLVVNGNEITLKEDTTKYQVSVSFQTKKVEIEAIPNSSKATVVDFKNDKATFDFYENSKEFKIKVESEAGDMTTYIVTVTKRDEADATLKTLTIKNYDIDFSSEVLDYELKVLKNVDKLDITAKAVDSKANVKITNPKLSIGENEIKIEVENDGSKNTYTIKVTKINEDDKTLANLKALTIDNYDIDFKPDKYEYELNIENENYLVIKATPKMNEAVAEITGNLDLENESIIKIKVTYDDEYSNVYKIKIFKENSMVIKKDFSKKGALAVIIFDILAIIIIGTVKLIEKKKNKKDNNINVDII